MYPYLRTLHSFTRRVAPLESIWKPLQKNMRVWPGDIDIFMEVNNGRYLTLMDFGRFEYFRCLGWGGKSSAKWGGAVAGVSVRYRKRLHLFQKFKLHTRLVALDERWWYFGQTIERNGDIHVSALVRFAVTDAGRSVSTKKLESMLDMEFGRKMPDWVKHWDDSDNMRPWISMSDPDATTID